MSERDEYTPSVAEVRERYVDGFPIDTWVVARDSVGAEFDRWLAEHDAQVRAEALREAADIASEYDREALHMRDHESDYPDSRVGMQYHGMHHGAADVAIRLRRRADQIEQGGEK